MLVYSGMPPLLSGRNVDLKQLESAALSVYARRSEDSAGRSLLVSVSLREPC